MKIKLTHYFCLVIFCINAQLHNILFCLIYIFGLHSTMVETVEISTAHSQEYMLLFSLNTLFIFIQKTETKTYNEELNLASCESNIYIYIFHSCYFEQVSLDIQQLAHLKLLDEIDVFLWIMSLKQMQKSKYILKFEVSNRFRQGSLFRDVFFLFLSSYIS